MSNYGLALHITGDNLEYFDKVIKFLTLEECTIKDIQYFNRIVDYNMVINEHYIVCYYINYLNKIEPLSKVDLDLIVKLTNVDKEKIVNLKHIDLTGVIDIKEEFKGQILVDMMDSYKERINNLENITREVYEHSLNLITELIKDLKMNNTLFVGSRILNGEYKVGKKILKGREDFVYFLDTEVRDIRNLDKEIPDLVYTLDRDKLLSTMYSTEPLFPHPIQSLQEYWGSVKRGNTLGVLAPMSVGKSTLTMNYMAKALEYKVNCALFISEMEKSQYVSRIVSIIGANKYNIFLDSNIVSNYLDLEHKKYLKKELSKSDLTFLDTYKNQINNIEYILNQLFAESNKDLGSLRIVEDLYVEEIPQLYQKLKSEETYLMVVDHINGLQSRNSRKNVYELTNEGYVDLHGESKKNGIATIITNHIPDDQLPLLNDLDADLSNVRGSNAGQSTKSLDDVLILSATDEQKNVGQMVMRTNKNRSSGVFFDAILITHRKELGLLYESN